MDSNEPTAWEEINPPVVSAARPEPPCEYLDPASNVQFRNELTACLTLVAPVGMTEEAKADWFAVAWATLNHLPADLLSAGCMEARRTADHPSKIVPAIIGYAEARLASRKRSMDYDRPLPALTGPKPEYCTPAQAAKILKEFGLKSNPVAPEDAA